MPAYPTLTPGPPIQCSLTLRDDPKERLLFESFPSLLTEGYNVSYNARGTSRTTQQTLAYYKGGDYTSFNLSLKFVAGLHITEEYARYTGDEQRDNHVIDLQLQAMENKVRWCQALCFPRPKKPRASANAKYVVADDPPMVLVTFGRFLTIIGKASSFTVVWGGQFHPTSVRPSEAEVSLTLVRIGTFYPDWWDISKKGQVQIPPLTVGLSVLNSPTGVATRNIAINEQGARVEQAQAYYGQLAAGVGFGG